MKIKRSLFSLILSVLLILALIIPTAAAGNNNTAVYTHNEAFVFPTQPGSTEWKEFQTKQEKLAACQIPEEKLSAMTTEALLETVLSYPLIHDYFAFNTPKDAFHTIYEDFNGLRALLERDDITKVLLNTYSKAAVMTTTQYNIQMNEKGVNDLADQFFLSQTLEFLISCDQMENGEYAKEQSIILNAEVLEKEIARSKSGLYSTVSDIYQSYTSEKTSLSRVVLMAGEYFANSSVTTPNGTSVATLFNRNPDFTPSEKNILNTQMATSYPNATYVREPTVRYNCHSYAWYNQLHSNMHWIEIPSSYMTDGSYSLYSGTPSAGMKVHYYNGNHSGIVSNVSNGTIKVYSKWGACGLYQHTLNDCPYTAGTRFYTR